MIALVGYFALWVALDVRVVRKSLGFDTWMRTPSQGSGYANSSVDADEDAPKIPVETETQTFTQCPVDAFFSLGGYPIGSNGVWTWKNSKSMEISKQACAPRAYNGPDACNALDGMTVTIIGDSTSRRLWYTLQALFNNLPQAVSKPDGPPSLVQQLPDHKTGMQWLAATSSTAHEFPSRLCGGRVKLAYLHAPTVTLVESALKQFIRDFNFESKTKRVVVASAGSWALLDHRLDSESAMRPEKEKLSSAFEAVRAFSDTDGGRNVLWIWRSPTPVDDEQFRFLRKGANEKLRLWGEWTLAEAKKYGVRGLDTFSPIDHPASGTMWEMGTEWRPQQYGGIHLFDEGRRTLAQLVVNAIAIFHSCKLCK